MVLVISLTTIPSRFDQIGPTLDSLLAQSRRPDHIQLHIPKHYRRFPDYDGRLPKVPRGIEIIRPDEDLGPATKVLPAARTLRGTSANLLFCDDDRIYHPRWAERLTDAQQEHPDACIAALGCEASLIAEANMARAMQPRAAKRPWEHDPWYMARYAWWLQRRKYRNPPDRPRRQVFRRPGYIDIFMGFGGVLVRPEFFDDTAYEIPEICWTVDDFWLSGMLAARGIPIWIATGLNEPQNTDCYMNDALFAATISGIRRPDAETHCVEHLRERYGIWS
ncbi:glycosyltransferase family A protein [Candidatus Rhodobacter oscarellae]|uniref:glycosyltransferase family A protein n=1 Tax=Candidatus Rhodobacter oscarellae TaxID=1675527 RepID=UPI000670D2FA|nr:glycosyltransferase family A protein [Candidatus Rhodobacter lobularis]